LSAGDLATVPDRSLAEEGVRLSYRAASLSQPQTIWCDGPLELATLSGSAAGSESAGPRVKHVVFDRPYRRAVRRLEELGKDDKARLMPMLAGGEQNRLASAVVQSTVTEAMEGIRPSLLSWIKRPKHSASLCAGWRPAFEDCGCGPRELDDASVAASIEQALDGEASQALRGLQLVARNAGWFVPYEGVCWLSRRPETLSTDALGRLHSASGPALSYPDGWSIYAWKGVQVPSWIVMQPQKITHRWIDAQIEPEIRHAMIDIVTPEHFIASGGADRAERDEAGTLWRRKWSHRGVVIDTWAAVEPAHERGTFRCVPARLSTPRDALDWIAATPFSWDSPFEAVGYGVGPP